MALDDPRADARDPAVNELIAELAAIAAADPAPTLTHMEHIARLGSPDTQACYLTHEEMVELLARGESIFVASNGIPDELTFEQAQQLEVLVHASTGVMQALQALPATEILADHPAKLALDVANQALEAAAPADPAIRRNFLLSLPVHAVEALARGPGPAAASTTHNQELPHGR